MRVRGGSGGHFFVERPNVRSNQSCESNTVYCNGRKIHNNQKLGSK
jgi:hypothetical protein